MFTLTCSLLVNKVSGMPASSIILHTLFERDAALCWALSSVRCSHMMLSHIGTRDVSTPELRSKTLKRLNEHSIVCLELWTYSFATCTVRVDDRTPKRLYVLSRIKKSLILNPEILSRIFRINSNQCTHQLLTMEEGQVKCECLGR